MLERTHRTPNHDIHLLWWVKDITKIKNLSLGMWTTHYHHVPVLPGCINMCIYVFMYMRWINAFVWWMHVWHWFMWSIGATLSKGCNRGAGTLLAGLLAVLIGQVAHMSGGISHPIIVGVSTFVVGKNLLSIYLKSSASMVYVYRTKAGTFICNHKILWHDGR